MSQSFARFVQLREAYYLHRIIKPKYDAVVNSLDWVNDRLCVEDWVRTGLINLH
jgi:hypothetical protein